MSSPIRDSIKSCSGGEDPPYIYNPFAPPIRAKSIPKDTIETTQQKLNKQVKDQFKNDKSPLVFFISTLGRFFFIVVVFPPYFMLFALPKLIANEIMPKLLELLSENFNKGLELLLQLATLMKVKFTFPIRYISRRCKKALEHVRNRIKDMKKSVERATKQGLQPFLRMIEKSLSLVKRGNQTFLDFFSSKQQTLKSKFESIKVAFLKLPKAIVKKTLAVVYPQAVPSFFKSMKTWISTKGKDVFTIVKQENLNTKEKAEKIVQKWKEAMRPRVETFAKMMQAIKIQAGNLYQQLKSQVVEWTKPRLTFAWTKAKEFGQMIKTGATESFTRFVDMSKLGLQWTKIQISPGYQMLAQTTQNFLKLLPQTITSWLSVGKDMGFQLIAGIQKAAQFLVIKSLSLKKMVITAIQTLYRFLKSLKEKGKQAFQQSKKYLTVVVKRAARIVMKIVEKGTIWLIRLVLWVRIVIAWISVLSLYGMQLLPQLAAQIFRKFRSLPS
ncbi:hypothetical protein [Parachlamydia acanthamoebae]|uniref:hypothetical protein n=1 Tax=Parachlamydia acanthamoebae TaxID=83552 RepID=UPI000750C65E|nr:hypothetical protein [Parachlamydia acanthamoebae]